MTRVRALAWKVILMWMMTIKQVSNLCVVEALRLELVIR
jgi:hypothetical protein